jgi:hypothetical protein
VSAAESALRPGSLPTRRAGGDWSSDCHEATSLARRATAWSSTASRAAPGIWALAACCGVEEAAAGDGDLLDEDEAEFVGELMLMGDPGLVGGGAEIEDGVAAYGGCGEAGD